MYIKYITHKKRSLYKKNKKKPFVKMYYHKNILIRNQSEKIYHKYYLGEKNQ